MTAVQPKHIHLIAACGTGMGSLAGMLKARGYHVTQCRAAWEGHGGVLDRIRAALAGTGSAPPSRAQRLAAQLADLDDELLRFSTGANRRVSGAVGFDALRWFDAVGDALRLPVEASDYPGRKFTVQCASGCCSSTLAMSQAFLLGP